MEYGVGAVTAIACLAVLAAAVYLYGRHGGDWVDGLSPSVGEVTLLRAESLAAAGDTDAAQEQFWAALELDFDHPESAVRARMGLARLLMDKDRPAEAAEVLEPCRELAPDSLKVFGALASARAAARDYEGLEALSEDWLEAARAADDTVHQGLALYNRGQALEQRGETDEALEAYLQGHKIDPAGYNGYNAAVQLAEAGRRDEAAALLRAYRPRAVDWRRDAARRLLAELSGEAP